MNSYYYGNNIFIDIYFNYKLQTILGINLKFGSEMDAPVVANQLDKSKENIIPLYVNNNSSNNSNEPQSLHEMMKENTSSSTTHEISQNNTSSSIKGGESINSADDKGENSDR